MDSLSPSGPLHTSGHLLTAKPGDGRLVGLEQWEVVFS